MKAFDPISKRVKNNYQAQSVSTTCLFYAVRKQGERLVPHH